MGDRFFDQHQRETVRAALARMSSSRQPGDVGRAIDLLDRYLAGKAQAYPGPNDQTHVLNHGLDIVRHKYIAGIFELDRRSRATYGTHFTGLRGEQQDGVLADMEEAEDGPEPSDARLAAGVVPDESPQAGGLAEMGFLPLLATHAGPGFLASVTAPSSDDLTITG
jgi:gluconate 2-dehydrogenase gamma chain